MNAVSAGGADILTPASRGALSGAATSLLGLRLVQSEDRLTNTAPCGDGLCHVHQEHCGSCPQDCGACLSLINGSGRLVVVEVSVAYPLPIARQILSPVTLHVLRVTSARAQGLPCPAAIAAEGTTDMSCPIGSVLLLLKRSR